MRSIIKMLGLAFFATLAFSAVGALGASSASALLFLTESGNELLFTIKGLGLAVLETKNASKIDCKSTLGHGFIVNKSDSARKILLTFHECTSGALGACTSSGEPSGLITTLEMDALLVTLLSPLDKYGLKLLAEKGNLADFNCGIAAVTVKGTIVGEFEETLTESQTNKTEAKLVFEKGANPGEPFIKDYWTLQGVETAKLESTIAGATEEANEQALADILPNGGVKFCHN